MTRYLPFLFLFFFVSGAWAQVTITNASFPAVGDTLKTVFDGMPNGVEITPASGDSQTWSFSQLQGLTREELIRPASEGTNSAAFTNADIFTGSDLTGENYYRSTNTAYDFLGYAGPDPAGLNLDVVVKFSPPITERRAPMNYFDMNLSTSNLVLPFSADVIPSEILDSLPIVPDSIRLRVEGDRLDEVDAWGNLTIPGGTFDVLREKRVEERESFLDVKIGFFPWTDVTDLASGFFPFLGKDTLVSYHFMAEGHKEAIAVVNVDPTDELTVESVTYKAVNDVMTNVNYINRGKADVFAYPNPAIEDVRFEFLNLSTGTYKLKIFNILGVEVWSKNYRISNDRVVKVDLADFRKGTYLYSLLNETGKTITTKRLIIIRP